MWDPALLSKSRASRSNSCSVSAAPVNTPITASVKMSVGVLVVDEHTFTHGWSCLVAALRQRWMAHFATPFIDREGKCRSVYQMTNVEMREDLAGLEDDSVLGPALSAALRF